MISKLKQKMILLGIDPRRELKILLMVNIPLLISAPLALIFFKNLVYMITFIATALVFDFVFLTRYSKMLNDKRNKNLQDFATLFGYFRVYLQNGFSVYSALKELLNFANDDLKESLETLISEIDEDKSVQPFVKFARQFNEIIVEEMMISVYQLIDDGGSSNSLVQFELLFDKFSDLLYQQNLKHKDSKLGTLTSAPLVATCFLIIVLTIGIIGVLGELLNGL